MQFDGGQAELFRNFCVLDFGSIFNVESLNQLGHIRARGDGTSATKRLKLCFSDNTFVVDSDLKLHDVATPVCETS